MTYGTAVSLPGTVEIAPTDTGGSDVFDADNGAYCAEAYIEKVRSRYYKCGYSAGGRRNVARSRL